MVNVPGAPVLRVAASLRGVTCLGGRVAHVALSARVRHRVAEDGCDTRRPGTGIIFLDQRKVFLSNKPKISGETLKNICVHVKLQTVSKLKVIK